MYFKPSRGSWIIVHFQSNSVHRACWLRVWFHSHSAIVYTLLCSCWQAQNTQDTARLSLLMLINIDCLFYWQVGKTCCTLGKLFYNIKSRALKNCYELLIKVWELVIAKVCSQTWIWRKRVKGLLCILSFIVLNYFWIHDCILRIVTQGLQGFEVRNNQA